MTKQARWVTVVGAAVCVACGVNDGSSGEDDWQPLPVRESSALGYGGGLNCLKPLQTITLQNGVNGYQGQQDTTLSANHPTQNQSGLATLNVEGAGDGNELSVLLRWSLPQIPDNATLCKAYAELYVTNPTAQSYQYYLMSYPAWLGSQATWNVASISHPWQTPGALGANDRGPMMGAFSAPVANTTVRLDLPAYQVVPWFQFAASNSGIIIGNRVNDDKVAFASKLDPDPNHRPKLTLQYYLPP